MTIASRHVPGSPNYRLLLNNSKVRAALKRFRPDLIECQDAYNLPWAAIAHRKDYPETALVASYCTDFPTVYVERPFSKVIGRTLAGAISRLGYRYCGDLYRRFDAIWSLSENGGAAKLRALAQVPGMPMLAATPGEVPSVADFFRSIIPPNVIAAASKGEVLQLVVFSLAFALAITRRPAKRPGILITASAGDAA